MTPTPPTPLEATIFILILAGPPPTNPLTMAEANVNAVSLKLPTFWPANPEVWFQQAEAQFAVRNITADETKYFYVVAALDQDSATRLLDFLKAPPAAAKYDAVKTRLLSTFTLSAHERAGLLLSQPGLGSDSPTALMDKMLALMGDHPPCFLFRRLFVNLMPEDIRPVLVHTEIADARELAKLAERLCTARSDNVHAVSSSSSAQRGHKRPNPGEHCWYHTKYGTKARRCIAPCSFSPSLTKTTPASVSGNAVAGSQ